MVYRPLSSNYPPFEGTGMLGEDLTETVYRVREVVSFLMHILDVPSGSMSDPSLILTPTEVAGLMHILAEVVHALEFDEYSLMA